MRYVSLLLFLAAIGVWPVHTEIDVDRNDVLADGRSTVRARARRTGVFGQPTPFEAPPIEIGDPLDATILQAHDGSTILRAGVRPGTIELVAGDTHTTLSLALDPADTDEDGFPDVAELLTEEDRAAFRHWFTAIAEAQAHTIDDAWPKVHQDCAGLIRFAYREALRSHDAEWRARRRHMTSGAHRDVAAFQYPSIPLLDDEPFRRTAGAFDPRDSDQFTAAANATTLWQYNTRFVSKDVAAALPGDLFFFDTEDGKHSMIVLSRDRVVYHTGSDDGVRLVSFDMLQTHPDGAWHPVPHNPKFLGVFRFEILTHDPRAPLALGGLK